MTRVAILIPCFNEATTIATVVRDFAAVLPEADIFVYDNNSTDGTFEAAKLAGATVRYERNQGKGNVVRRMFADIDADVYLMVDGDATYDASTASRIVDLVLVGNDMVNVARVSTAELAYRPGHKFGNWLLTSLVGSIFGSRTIDMLSGYKAFSRRFVKTFPAISPGFEIETELMIHALELRVSITEIDAPYGERPEGSVSKLSTFKDAFKILRMIAFFVKNERPVPFFSAVALFFAGVSLMLGGSVFVEFLDTGMVARFPTAILAAALATIGVLSLFSGLILDAQTVARREAKRIAYLQIGSPLRKNT